MAATRSRTLSRSRTTTPFLGTTDPATGRPERDFGYDDVVVCAGVSGRVYGIEALGNTPRAEADSATPRSRRTQPGQPRPEGGPAADFKRGGEHRHEPAVDVSGQPRRHHCGQRALAATAQAAAPSRAPTSTIRSPAAGRARAAPPAAPAGYAGSAERPRPLPAGYISAAPPATTPPTYPDVAAPSAGVPGVAITHFRPELDPNCAEADPRFQPPRPPFQPRFRGPIPRRSATALQQRISAARSATISSSCASTRS